MIPPDLHIVVIGDDGSLPTVLLISHIWSIRTFRDMHVGIKIEVRAAMKPLGISRRPASKGRTGL